MHCHALTPRCSALQPHSVESWSCLHQSPVSRQCSRDAGLIPGPAEAADTQYHHSVTFSKLCSGCILNPLLKAADPLNSGPGQHLCPRGPAVTDRGNFPLPAGPLECSQWFPIRACPTWCEPMDPLAWGSGTCKGNVHMDKIFSWGIPFNNEY